MQTHLSHIQFNVRPENLAFYRDLVTTLGWQLIFDNEGMLGVADGGQTSLWFIAAGNDAHNDYDGTGMNHFAFGAETQADVDSMAAYLQQRGVELLFETPRHRPEFSQSEDHTYYQVMFETPDRLLIEVVYIGPRAAV